jgi:isopenicillin N synthase-like dioxygenase
MNIPQLALGDIQPSDLDAACREWGCFALYGHDLDAALIKEVLQQTRSFFRQPADVKNRIRRSERNSWGYYDAELTKNRPDWKEIIDIGPPVRNGPLAGSHPQWPELAGFKTCMQTLQQQMHEAALHVLDALGKALQTDEDLRRPFTEHSSFLRLNFYPPCPDPATEEATWLPDEGQFGISHHTDAGAVTVLLQDDHAGLQMYHERHWHTVPPSPGALIINIGDVVQVWSNDRYPAPLHRVLASPDTERISLPYFLNPSYAYDYAPLTTGLAAHAPPRYAPINWGYFREQRSAGDYADYGEEIQISNFALANSQR